MTEEARSPRGSENIEDGEAQRPQALPYSDVRNPFSVDQSGAFAEYILRDPDAMPDLALGSRVLIKDVRLGRTVWLDGTVAGLRTISPYQPARESLLYIENPAQDPTKLLADVFGPHSHQPMLIRVRLNQELTVAETESSTRFIASAVQRPPSGSSRLRFPELLPDEKSEAPALSELLSIRPSGLRFGAVGFGSQPYQQDGKFLIYHWDVAHLDNKHMFIVGESGSGKTVFLKHLALEIRSVEEQDYRVIMTDIQGDLSQLFFDDFVSTPTPRGWQTNIEHPKPEEARDAIRPLNLVLPATKQAHRSESIVSLKKLAKNRGVRVHEIGLRLQDLTRPSDVEYLFRVASEQAAMLLDEEAADLDRHDQRVTIDRLRTQINARINATQGQQFNSSEGTQYYKSTGFAALRALKNLEGYFDHHQPSMQASDDPLNAFRSRGTTIVYLEHLSYEERLMWEMQLVRWLYANKRLLAETFVFFDEAHQIVPAGTPGFGDRGTFARLRGTFENLAREGRKFGIHLVLSTQSPQDLHEIVPQQCPTRIVMKLDPGNQKHAHLDQELAMIASRFGHGQFWLKSPFNGTPDWVRIHAWLPPLPHSAMNPYWKDVHRFAEMEH